MFGTFSSKVVKEFESILKELGSCSLLQDDEVVMKGFYPVRINTLPSYCLLTNYHILFSTQGVKWKRRVFELYPINKIERISLDNLKDIKILLMDAIPLFIGGLIIALIFIPFFQLIIEDENLGTNIYKLIMVLLWFVFTFTLLNLLMKFYRFYKGDETIILKTPGKDLKIRGIYGYGYIKMRKIFFLESFGGKVRLEKKIIKIEELYNIISGVISKI